MSSTALSSRAEGDGAGDGVEGHPMVARVDKSIIRASAIPLSIMLNVDWQRQQNYYWSSEDSLAAL